MSATANQQTVLDARFGIAAQTTWGTEIADDAAFIELDCDAYEIMPDIKELHLPGAHANRTGKDSDYYYHTNGSAPTCTISMPAKMQEIDFFLYSAMGSVTEAATSPYKKTFTMSSTQPNFSNDEGEFFTIIERDPAASKSTKIEDATCKSLTLAIEKGGLLHVSAEMIARDAPSFTANPSGTWSRTTLTPLEFNELDRVTIDFGSGAVNFNMESFELAISHDAEPIGQDGSGSFQTFGLHNRQINWKMKVIKDADYHSALSNWSGNTAVDVNVGWGHATPGTTNNDFDIAIHGKINDSAKDYANILKGEFKGVALEADGGSTAALTIVMANSADQGW